VFSNEKRHHHIIANRGSVWRVCLGGGNSLQFFIFFAVATSMFITNAFIWKEKSKREIREISDGTGRGTVVVLGEVVLSFCISWGVLQWVQGLVFHHHGVINM